MHNKKLAIVVVSCLFAMTFTVGMRTSGAAFAQGQPTLDVRTSVADDSYAALKENPIMVSVIRNAEIVKQREVLVNSNAAFALPQGLYDVRLEGDGMQTLVKRGFR